MFMIILQRFISYVFPWRISLWMQVSFSFYVMLSTQWFFLHIHFSSLKTNFLKACIPWFIEACFTFNDTVSKLLLANP